MNKKLLRKTKGTKPTIGRYIDDEERELVELIESDNYQICESHLSPEVIEEARQAAINTKRERISIRIPREDLELIKIRAKREGMPYQTLINSILHKAVNK